MIATIPNGSPPLPAPASAAPAKAAKETRIFGFDVARALAILGMVVVNFELSMNASGAGPGWLTALTDLLHGRAAALFVLLAGVGLSLMGRKALKDPARVAPTRRSIWKRAAFLGVIGLAWLPIWPADILHFYALYMAIGGAMIAASDRALLAGAAGSALASVAMMLTLDYGAGWDFETLEYSGIWTPAGMVRHLLFNGFHPVFPWVSFLLVGMWLGRRDLSVGKTRLKLAAVAGATLLGAESASAWLVSQATGLGLSLDDALALFGAAPMPPTPLYLLSAGASAVLVILACVELTLRMPQAGWLKPMVRTGQLALTLYLAHVLVGLAGLDALGLMADQSLGWAVGCAVAFFAASVAFATRWRERFQRGPAESAMRALTS